ncbi:hypothetical protein DL98DRAFT_523633 [Cadophora sp. DSE1049]|nr:hypothetical protein DL98DRAFT_523633 [Cadophora sp. DSE1049]
MDHSSLYQRLVSRRREIMNQRLLEDATFKAYENDSYSDIQTKKDAKITEHNANAQRDETELGERENTKLAEVETRHRHELDELIARHEHEAADLKSAREFAVSKLLQEQKTALEKLEDFYTGKEDKARAKIEELKITLKNSRDDEDAKLSKELFEALDEESSQTIEVDSPGVSVSNAGQSLQHIVNFKTRLATSYAEQSSTGEFEQQSPSNEGRQTPKSQLRVGSQVTPTKRSMADSPCENRQPPSFHRFVSENFRPVAVGDIFNSSSPPASSELSVSPNAYLPAIPDPPPESPSRPISISSASSQSTVQGSFQDTQPATPRFNRRQTIGTNGRANGINLQPPADLNLLTATPPRAMLQSPFKSNSQGRSLSSNTPRHSPKSSPQQNSSPASVRWGRPVCVNFEITEVRYNYADGGFYHWTREAEEGPRYFRLSENSYRPVLKHGKKCGTVEWNIDPSRVWFLKYNLEAALLYINRSKADVKTGNAGKEMWVKFKDQLVLEGFLTSYKENWEHIKIDELDLDEDDVPLSMAKSCR